MTTSKVVDGKLEVPDNVDITYIAGDGIGAEIWEHAQRVLDTAVATAYGNQKKISWVKAVAGEEAYKETGEYLPQQTIDSIKETVLAIKGPLATPVGEGIRSINVALRQVFDLYACVRPIRYFKGVPSVLLHPERTNMVLFRENTEDLYAGIEWESQSSAAKKVIEFLQEEMGVSSIRFPKTSAIGVKPISKEGSSRLITAAIEYALSHGLTHVTLVHKGNIQKYTEGGFRKWGYEIAKQQYGQEVACGKLVVTDLIADNFFQQILLYPEQFQVVALTNLNGDYASDALAAQVGGLGIAPGANINYQTGYAIFEATHGVAPSIVGKNQANPCSLLLSACMMLTYMGWEKASATLLSAIEKSLAQREVTKDLADLLEIQGLSTSEFTSTLLRNLEK